jgi:hypothetical protein
MMIIGCDFHPSFQQIAFVDQETGKYGERRLNHREDAVRFCGSLAGRKVVVGLEATGNDRWFRKLVLEAGHDLVVGDASAIHTSAPREQRTDKRDARHILKLLVEAATTAQRYDPSWHRQYVRLSMTKHHGVAKVAFAHKLAVRMYWMSRPGQDYGQMMERGSHARQSECPGKLRAIFR